MADSDNRAKAGEWTTPDKLKPELKPGDLIEMDRGQIQHWAVCVEVIEGKAIIVHVTGDVASGLGKILKTRKTISDIRVEELDTVVADSPCRVNNTIDELYDPFPAGAEVVKRGLSQLGEHEYDPMKWNCEHWASWCRNGNRVSLQADEIQKKVDEFKNRPKEEWEVARKQAQTWQSERKSEIEEFEEVSKSKFQEMKSDMKSKFKKSKNKDENTTPFKVDIPKEYYDKFPVLQKFHDLKLKGAGDDADD